MQELREVQDKMLIMGSMVAQALRDGMDALKRQDTDAAWVVVAATSGDDTVLMQVLVDPTMVIPPQVFPPRWIDPAGPWFPDVFRVALHAADLQKLGYLGVLVTIKGAEKADRIQVGLQAQELDWHKKNFHRPFYVAGLEVLTVAEADRFDYDTKEQKKKQGVLEAALSDSSSGQALLKPNTAYSVTVQYDAKRGTRKPGEPVKDIVDAPNQHQTFWFFTDDQAPRRLDPWILCSIPEDGEHHYFGEVPVSVVFNTPDVGRIYAAYGKRLQVRLRAASFRPPPSTAAVPHPFPLTEAALKVVPATILSPWEEVMSSQLQGSCVPVSGSRGRHVKTTIPIPLEPFTDYVLDIESVAAGAPANQTGDVVWRTGFTTGRFPLLAKMAQSFALDRVLHRFSKPGALQAIGGQSWAANPQGNQLDQAMIDAGLEPMGVPDGPRLVVFWEAAVPNPQPAAVLVDCSEPMWRSRKIPKQVEDPNPPKLKRFEMTPTEWLRLEEQAGGDAIVDKIVRAPGAQRALITLKPNARGKRLRLALRQIAQKEAYLDGPAAVDQLFNILDTKLTRAPWEEED